MERTGNNGIILGENGSNSGVLKIIGATKFLDMPTVLRRRAPVYDGCVCSSEGHLSHPPYSHGIPHGIRARPFLGNTREATAMSGNSHT